MKTEAEKKLQEVWYSMRYRCTHPNDAHWNRYGGRGITVCDEWSRSGAFIEWALANGYQEGLTLDRRDNDKGYSADNCRWVTRKEQQRNTAATRRVTLCGETRALVEWAEIIDISPNGLRRRLRSGWSDERIITQPVRGRNT